MLPNLSLCYYQSDKLYSIDSPLSFPLIFMYNTHYYNQQTENVHAVEEFLIVNQSVEVQQALSERLNRMVGKRTSQLEPYSIQELHNRINESQRQIECDDTSTMQEVDKEVKLLFTSWK